MTTPKLPLKSLSKVYLSPGVIPGSDIIVWAGKSNNDISIILGAIWQNDKIIQIFGKGIESDADKELELLKTNLPMFKEWESQDMSSFTPGQQEEASIVRGWIIEDDFMLKEAETIIGKVESKHNEHKPEDSSEPNPFRI